MHMITVLWGLTVIAVVGSEVIILQWIGRVAGTRIGWSFAIHLCYLYHLARLLLCLYETVSTIVVFSLIANYQVSHCLIADWDKNYYFGSEFSFMGSSKICLYFHDSTIALLSVLLDSWQVVIVGVVGLCCWLMLIHYVVYWNIYHYWLVIVLCLYWEYLLRGLLCTASFIDCVWCVRCLMLGFIIIISD